MKQIGLRHIHLAVRPALGKKGSDYLQTVRQQRWIITSAMLDFPQEDYSTLDAIKITGGIVPDDCWSKNRKLFLDAATLTSELGVKYLSMHAGFIDETDAAYARKIHNRIRALADAAGEHGIMLLLETGQETAEELRHFLEKLNHPALGVNFDPANMILYDKGDPLDAVRLLAPWVKHIHIKDAIKTKTPGTWGAEVPWGTGQVGGEKFLRVLAEMHFKGALAIEREAGDNRFGDIRMAAEKLRSFGS
jgi:sugar phosphate isomerase/epimerase